MNPLRTLRRALARTLYWVADHVTPSRALSAQTLAIAPTAQPLPALPRWAPLALLSTALPAITNWLAALAITIIAGTAFHLDSHADKPEPPSFSQVLASQKTSEPLLTLAKPERTRAHQTKLASNP